MDKETLTALNGSIEKWKKIVKGVGVDEHGDNCPLCQLYFDNNCKLCPVCIKVGDMGCQETPWVEWNNHLNMVHRDDIILRGYKANRVHCSVCQDLALKELDFLKSLLPK